MKRVGVREFRDHATRYLSQGEVLAVERHGRPIGCFIPARASAEEDVRQALERLHWVVEQSRPGTRRSTRSASGAQAAVAVSVRQVPHSIYGSVEAIARERIPRDPDDWPTVALVLVLEAGIWTHDADFLGCGVPT
jgi:antitoxin (DNA-binding transcriptional repressor) of toxin-antitoxin stability system